MIKTPTLKTERLILRPIALSDAPAVQRHFNNWNIIQHLSTQVPWPYPEDGAESFISETILPRIADGDAHCWVIVEKSGNDDAIGLVDFRLKKFSDGNRGFWLSEDHHGKGYMTEAIAAVHDFIFDTLNLDQFEVGNAKTNIASRRVKEKTGAIYVEDIELEHRSGERVCEKWIVTKQSWQSAKENLNY